MPQMFPSPILLLMVVVSMICFTLMVRLFWNTNFVSIKNKNLSESLLMKNKSKEFNFTW